MVTLGLASGIAAAAPPEQAAPSTGPERVVPALEALVAPLPIAPAGLPADPPEVCRREPGGLAWIDRMQAGLYRSLCLTAAGFDGMFGNTRFDDEYEKSHGSIALGALWDERDHWDPTLRFRANLRLPQLDENLRAFIGRVDPDEYVSELRDDFDALPRQFGRTEDDTVLVGLGYRQPGPGGGNFDTGIGARFGWPLEPYVKGSYRLIQPFLERNLLRFDQTLFWREDEGFGTTTRLDLEQLLADRFLLRWSSSGTFSEETEGLRWLSTFTLYHSLGDGRALAYQAGIWAETDAEVDVNDYGLRVIYRRLVYRDWLFLELRSGVTWPRETQLERREANWGGGVALEMQFGERAQRAASRPDSTLPALGAETNRNRPPAGGSLLP